MTKRYGVFLALWWATAAHAADIAVVPQATSTSVGASFTVALQVTPDGTGVIGVDGYLTFDATKAQVLSVTPGGVLANVLLNRYSNNGGTGTGTIDCSAGAAFGSPPPTSPFTLCTVQFGALTTGTTILHFTSALPRKTEIVGPSGSVLGTVTDGSVTIGAAVPTPTRTPTGPPAATPTPAPAPACCGDCNDDGLVTTAEYEVCRRITVGSADRSACPACDCNGDGQVLGNELTQVIINSASGCPQPTPVAGAPWAINPRDRGAVAFNSLDCRGTTGKPCLRLPILSGTPTAQQAGDVWCEDQGSTHRCCYATSPTTRYCWNGS